MMMIRRGMKALKIPLVKVCISVRVFMCVFDRFERRIFVPLPDEDARQCFVEQALQAVKHDLSPSDVRVLAQRLEGCVSNGAAGGCATKDRECALSRVCRYSGADIQGLMRATTLGILREALASGNPQGARVMCLVCALLSL